MPLALKNPGVSPQRWGGWFDGFEAWMWFKVDHPKTELTGLLMGIFCFFLFFPELKVRKFLEIFGK